MISWDIVMALSQAVLGAFIIPMLRDSTAYVPRLTSIVYAVFLGVIALTLLNIGSPLGGLIAGISAVLWAFVFVFRGKAPNLRPEDTCGFCGTRRHD